MKKLSSILLSIIALSTVCIQLFLMIQNRNASVVETIIRFFSFFTILTNLLVGIYFGFYYYVQLNSKKTWVLQAGTLTAITVYITIVGLVYQVALRHVWEPTGLQKIVDELLHSVIPLLVIVFWYFYENKKALLYKSILKWLLYPIIYLIYILIRGHFSNFYPYPFINVAILGVWTVAINSCILILVFTFISFLFITIGRKA